MDLSTRFSQELALPLDGFNIICRASDGYINASQLCKAGGKLFSNWRKSQKTEEFLQELEGFLSMEKSKLMQIISTLKAKKITPEQLFMISVLAVNGGNYLFPFLIYYTILSIR